MHPHTAPAAGCATESEDHVTKTPVLRTHEQQCSVHYLNEEDRAPATATPNNHDGYAKQATAT